MLLTRKEITSAILAEYGDFELALVNGEDKGICHNCGHIQSGVEPDASHYPCEECNENEVFGVEETIVIML